MNESSRALLLTLFGVACGGSDPSKLSAGDLAAGPFGDDHAGLITQQEAEVMVTGIAGGTVVSNERAIERGLSVFEVKVRLDSGASIEVKVDEATGRVVEIEGESGPFDDEIAPSGFISLADAVTRATALHPGAVLVRYELELDDSLRWKYELEITVDAVLYEIELDARTGDLLEDEVEAEAEHDGWDDNGGDGDEPGDDHGG